MLLQETALPDFAAGEENTGMSLKSKSVFAEALLLAEKPNYLGSPKVMTEVITIVVNAAIRYSDGEANFRAVSVHSGS